VKVFLLVSCDFFSFLAPARRKQVGKQRKYYVSRTMTWLVSEECL